MCLRILCETYFVTLDEIHSARGSVMNKVSIRTYMLLLVLAISIPFTAVVGYGIYRDMQQAIAGAKNSLRILAATMVNNTGGKIASARHTLEQLASRAAIRQLDGRHCDPALQELHTINPIYANIVISDLNGVIVCSAQAQALGKMVTVSKTAHFIGPASAQGFHIAPPHRGSVSGTWATVLSTPVRNNQNQVIGVIRLSLDVSAFDPNIPTDFLPASSRYGFFNADGTLIWRNSDPDRVIGTKPDSAAAREIVRVRDGAFESLAIDGVIRYFTVAPMPELGWVTFIGVPVETVFAEARTRALHAALIAFVAIALMLLFALWLARRITLPMVKLEKVAHAVHQGDLSIRASLEGPSDVAAVALEFNAMLAAQQRNEEQLRAFLENSVVIAWLKDEDGRHLFASDNFLNQYALAREAVIGRIDHEIWPRELADEYRANDLLLLKQGGAVESISPTPNPDGSISWWQVNKFVFTGSDGTRVVGGLAVDITERKQIADQNDMILQTAMDGFWLVDKNASLKEVNATACAMLGYTREEMLKMRVTDIDWNGEDELEQINQRIALVREKGSLQFESRHRCKDGHIIDVEIAVRYLATQEMLPVFVRDITARKQAERHLHLAATVFESHEGMFVTDVHSKIQQVNRAFTEITGYSKEEAIGQTPDLLDSGRHDAQFFDGMTHALESDGTWQGEIWNRRKNGEVYPLWLTITAVRGLDGEITHYVSTLTDITLRKAAEDEIRNLAFYDPLTRLPNRRLLIDRLRQALVSSVRSRHKGALMYLDLDNFKTLNDTQGHYKGDLLLQQVSVRLTSCVREADTVARIGGDEFVLLLEDLSELSHEAANQIEALGKKILDVLNQPYDLDGYEYCSTPSIGATLITDHLIDFDELMKQADLAMYAAKSAGRNTMRFFDPDMQLVVSARASMEKELRDGLRAQQLVLYYQAQMDSAARIIGVEALVRWCHPRRGLVAPAEFIPLAEATGLILPLGKWVLESACRQIAAWASRPEVSHITVAVNVSTRQFRQTDFVAQVLEVLEQTGANPARLKLELTESLLVDDVEDIIGKMSALKEKGVCFSLDDFGTGYSSLTYLKRLPLDQLKIDQSFVRDVLSDPNDAAIARTILALGQSLGLSVIAEGVENAEQRDYLACHGCIAYQGYFFGRPVPLEEFEMSLR